MRERERVSAGVGRNGSVFSFLSQCSEKAISFRHRRPLPRPPSLPLCNACPRTDADGRTPLLISEASVFNEHCCFVRALTMYAAGRARRAPRNAAGTQTISRNLTPRSLARPVIHGTNRRVAALLHASSSRQANIFQSERASRLCVCIKRFLGSPPRAPES